MTIYYLLFILTLIFPAEATLEVRTGLLDRLVQFYKNSFFHDLLHVAPVKLDVSIKPAPEGYRDPPSWNYESVVRLLGLLRESDSQPARRVHNYLQALKEQPTRRYLGMGRLHKRRQFFRKRMEKCAGNPKRPGYPKYCPKGFDKNARNYRKGLSRLYIPSFSNPNDMYYDEMIPVVDTRYDSTQLNANNNNTIEDDEILVISNPVEAKLPSGHISIAMLRRILEARAEAARVMPTQPPPPNDTTIDGSDSNSTKMEEGGANSTDVGEETTATGGEADAVTEGEGGDDANPTEGKPDEKPPDDAAPEGEEEAAPPADGEEEKPPEGRRRHKHVKW